MKPMGKRIVAITACPTGVAHTLWRPKPLKAKRNAAGGWRWKRGARRRRQRHHPEEVAAADLVDRRGGYRSDLRSLRCRCTAFHRPRALKKALRTGQGAGRGRGIPAAAAR
ncbi:hypothetical protein J4732_20060 [Serratia marcescens]|uniref:EIIBC-Fru n=1 Tax=Serratia marcescens TaxID=615 RepID=A0A939NPQ0_SERMA|nr:hypothetical protein [Serratia marcescens]